MKTGTFEEMLSDFKSGTFDLTKNGKCTQCGACCSSLLPMTDKEIEVIRRYIKKHHIKELKHGIPLANPVLDMTCPFLNTDKKTEKCMIYEARPNICRQFSCDPQQRPQLNMEYANKARIVDVRREFFNEKP